MANIMPTCKTKQQHFSLCFFVIIIISKYCLDKSDEKSQSLRVNGNNNCGFAFVLSGVNIFLLLCLFILLFFANVLIVIHTVNSCLLAKLTNKMITSAPFILYFMYSGN